jgi:hypothetical protein
MNASVLPELPPDLAARAAAVPGLSFRLLHFIRQEVALYERRQSRYSPHAKEIVRQATALAQASPMSEADKAEARRTFAARFETLIAGKP